MAYTNLAAYCNFGDGATTGYYAVAVWAAQAYVAGNLIRQTAPAVGNERVFVCTVGGTATTEPTWTITRGAANTSGTATFQEATGIPALNGDLTNTPNWTTVKNTTVSIGQVIKNNAGTLILLATNTAATGNGAEPSWSAYTTAGATTLDNAVTWVTLGSSYSAWASPHARLNNATSSANWFSGGNTGNFCFVGDNHAETTSTGGDVLVVNTSFFVSSVISVDHTVAPPVSGKVGASITVTGGGNFALGISTNSNNLLLYVYGLSLVGSTSTGAASGIILCASGCYGYFQNCSFTGSGNPGFIFNDAASFIGWVVFDNCNVIFNSGTVNTTIRSNNGRVIWNGGTLTITGTQPTSLITTHLAGSAEQSFIFEGVDLSAFTGTNLVGDQATPPVADIRLRDCKLGAYTNVGSFTALCGANVDLIRSDSANTNYVQLHTNYGGTMQTNTATVRSGGATDGVTAVSWQIATTANPNFVQPFQLPPTRIWNANIGGNVVVTMYGAGATVPNDNQLFFDVVYLGSSSSSLGTYVTAGQTNPLASGVAWTTDSTSSWTGSPANKFSKSITIVPQKPGYIYVYLKQAAASTTWYVDPLIVLS